MPMQILCLHGSRQCGEIFSQRVEPLLKATQAIASYVFVDAPIELPLEAGQTVPMRTWWEESGKPDLDSLQTVIASASGDTQFDGVLGFSQGAALAAYLALSATRSSSASKLHRSIASLRFIITAGGYALDDVAHEGSIARLPIPSLHIIGEQDECVLPDDSELLASLFQDSVVHRHAQSHVFPCKAKDVKVCEDFLQEQLAQLETSSASLENFPSFEATDDQKDEIEALHAIFMDEILESSLQPPRVRIKFGPETETELLFSFPPEYPDTLPDLQVFKAGKATDAILSVMRAEADQSQGGPMVFQIVTKAREWAEEAQWKGGRGGGGETAEQADDAGGQEGGSAEAQDQELSESVLLRAYEGGEEDWVRAAARAAAAWEAERGATVRESREEATASAEAGGGECGGGGAWRYCIGLVGKPSAGKSTLFNAAVAHRKEEDEAKIGSFPFTTITPNLGTAFFTAPPPPAVADIAQRVTPSWGFAGNGERKLPILLKDVAGLVPGAYQGRGKGNGFLNDLCDADVLIHVVDGSSATDDAGQPAAQTEQEERGGAAQGAQADAVQDGVVGQVEWVRAELHQWVYTNLRAKWSSVIRRGGAGGLERLLQLLSGYHASRTLALSALLRSGVSAKDDGSVFRSWGPRDLHLFTAHFLRVRFPLLLALNKADLPSAENALPAVQAAFPAERALAVSAATEYQLCRLRRRGFIEYETGGCEFRTREGELEGLDAVTRTSAEDTMTRVRASMQRLGGSTGVQEVVNAAVALRPPAIAYPVADLATCRCDGPGEGGGGQCGAILRDAVVLRPGSEVQDVFETLKRPPWGLVAGEFVRAECRVPGGQKRVVRKAEAITPENAVIRIMCNKRAQWQSKQQA